MFSLNKSLAQLKSALEDAKLAKKAKSELKTDESESKQNVETNKKIKKPKAAKKTQKVGGGPPKRGVIMIKNFPHGFYEKQMFSYFSQFGQVSRLKIARSRKTGNPRNYGFIEFQFEDVAKIAAETMNNYIMFDHVVKCVLLPEDKVPSNLFRNWNRPFVSTVKTHKVAHNQEKTNAQEYRLLCKRLKRVHNMEKDLSKKGIEFKCVIVNRPTGLKKNKKDSKEESKENIQKTATASPKVVTPVKVELKTPSSKAAAPNKVELKKPSPKVATPVKVELKKPSPAVTRSAAKKPKNRSSKGATPVKVEPNQPSPKMVTPVKPVGPKKPSPAVTRSVAKKRLAALKTKDQSSFNVSTM